MRRAIPGSGAPTTSGWKIAANASTPSTSRGPGRANDAFGVHGPHRYAARQHVAGDQVRRPARRPRPGGSHRAPPRRSRFGTRRPRPTWSGTTSRPPSRARWTPPARATISGTQCPGANGGSVHSRTRASGRAGPRRRLDRGQPLPQPGDQLLGRVASAAGPPEGHHGGEHLVEGVRVDGQHVRATAEVGQRLVDDRDVHGADRAEVLGDDQVGVQARQGALVEVVQVLAGPHPLADHPVDLGGAPRPSGRADVDTIRRVRASVG